MKGVRLPWGRGSAKGEGAIGLRIGGGSLTLVARIPGRAPVFRHITVNEGTEKETLSEVWKELGLRGISTAIMLRFSEYQLFLVDSPEVPDSELLNAVRWRIKDMIDYSPTEATVDLIKLPYAGQRNPQIYAVCARNSIISRYMQWCLQAGINLNVIDIPEMAIRNLVAVQDACVAALAFDETAGYVTFISKGSIFHVRHLDMGASMLDSVSTDRLVLEVQRSMDHVERQFHEWPVTQFSVFQPPGTNLMEGLGQALDLPLVSLDPPGLEEGLSAEVYTQAWLLHGILLRGTP
ncbi:MAG: hypothetical protein KGI54_01265 [Pseudomonadota bacterium]|nr:hypothetical protein [Pseudomonadota bacterium]